MLETITSWDMSILEFIQNNLSCEFLDTASSITSLLFSFGFALWGVLAILFLFFKKTRSMGIMMGVSMIFVLLICHLGLKNIVNRPRPFEAFPLADAKTFDHAHASGSSFPSTHSATAFAAAAIMFMKYKKVLWTMFLVAAFVGFTRMYMYVHYPSDVIAGAICGIIIALMVYYVFKFSGLMDRIDGVRPKNNKRGKKYGRA